MNRLLAISLVSALVVFAAPARSAGAEEARAAAERFGAALSAADGEVLRDLLPRKGKVRLRLVRLAGPEEGSYSAEQVESLLLTFLEGAELRDFAIVRTEGNPGDYGLIHASAKLVDRNGRDIEIRLHITFEPERRRWVLRELRETPP